MIPTWKLYMGGRKYLELIWDEKNKVLKIVDNPKGIDIDFTRPLDSYDPRVGSAEEVLPVGDLYSADLWINQWVQEQWALNQPFQLKAEGVDWGEILSPPEPGVLY